MCASGQKAVPVKYVAIFHTQYHISCTSSRLSITRPSLLKEPEVDIVDSLNDNLLETFLIFLNEPTVFGKNLSIL